MILSKKPLIALLATAGLMLSSLAMADIAITVNNAAGSFGGTVVVDYDYSALDADNVGGFQFDLTYDPAALTPTDITQCGANRPTTHNQSCTEPGGAGNGTVRTLIADFTFPTDEIMPLNIPSFGQLTFQINLPGTHTLTFTNGVGADLVGGDVAIAGNDATITGSITGAAGYASNPAPGATIALGSAVVGQTTAVQTITVSEIGDQQLDVAGAINGADAGDFSVAPLVFMIADGGADVDVNVDCTPSARGDLTASLDLTNNSINEPTPMNPLTCAGLSPNVNVTPTTINLNGVIGGTAPTGSFDVSNPDDGFASPATNASLTEGTAGGPITITNGLTDATIAVDETDMVTVSCDTTTSGMSSDTITVTWDDPAAAGGTDSAVVNVNCDIANAVPSFASTPTAPGPLAFGNVTNGTTSSPIGINVGNDGVGPAPQSNLDITSVVSSNPAVFAANLVNSGPFPVGPPSGADDITVTCSPPAGSTAQLTGTLTVNHDGDDNPTVFNMNCDPVTDAALTSAPPSGGTVNFGIIPPGSNNDTSITLTNTGTTDPISLDSCNLTADPEITLVSPVAFPVAIAAGASTDIVLNCAPSAPGSFTGTLACEASDIQGTIIPLNYNLICSGQAIEVPTLSRSGLLAMILALMAVGFIGFRLRQN